MPRIQVLPPGLVNQIAAGEVVERPASVVKELVENALDAGAHHVQIDVEDGGLRLIRVTDDGCGMAPEDAVLALERHATSKLADADGLSRIATMGFRGEALPAIASVARMRLDTAEGLDGAAVRLVVEGGNVLERGRVARARGTTIEVADLFFNTPARRKFMRAAATEAGHASETVVRLALARLDVGFTLRSAGRIAVASPAGAPLADRAAVALGRDATSHLLALESSRGDVRVHGAVTSPDHSQATGRALYLFVNGRYVRDRAAQHAVLRAYAGSLPQGRFPAGIVFVEIPLERVDVNVHPQKLEVRFADPRSVQDALFHAVAEQLRTAPWLRHRSPAAAAAPGGAGAGSAPPGARLSDVEVPLAGEEVASVLAEARAIAGSPEPPSANVTFAFPVPARSTAAATHSAPGYFGSMRFVGQHARTYLVCEAPGGALVVVDQHASHERVLFHRLREAWRARRLPVQPLLVPHVVTLPPAPARAIEAALDDLRGVGLDLEPFGGDAFAVKGVPAILGGVDVATLLADLGQQLDHVERGTALEQAIDDLLATMACHSAVRANQDLGREEVRALLDALDVVDFKARCPHGRPVVFELALHELEKRVGRR